VWDSIPLTFSSARGSGDGVGSGGGRWWWLGVPVDDSLGEMASASWNKEFGSSSLALLLVLCSLALGWQPGALGWW